MDTAKLGLATAKAMDQIERLVESGDIDGDSYIGAVTVVVAIDKKTPEDAPDRHMLRDVATQCFVFSEPDMLYVQMGLLELAHENYAPAELEGDD